MQNPIILDMASALARHSAMRHAVIAENVANADTPGYRARDLRPFAEVLAERFVPRATRAGHMGAAEGRSRLDQAARTVEIPGDPNGNSVSLADQSLRAVESRGRHALAMAVYQKSVDLMRIGIGRAR